MTMVFVLALAVAAAPIEESAAYREGVALYQSVDLEGAAAQFKASLAAANDDTERAKVHAWLGLIAAQLQNTDEAKAEFAQATKLDIAVAMPAEAPPAVTKLLDEARAAARPKQAPAPAPAEPRAPAPPPAASAEDGVPAVPIAVGAAGATLLLAGGVVFGIGLDTVLRQATDPKIFNDEANALVSRGYTEYAVGAVLAGLGVVGIGAGAALFVLE